MGTKPVEVDIEKGFCRIEWVDFPIVGFGTYRLKGEEGLQAIEGAWSAGYRIFDTATYYRNFKEIAQALQGKIRSDYYLISKVWHDKQLPPDLQKDLHFALKELKTDYLDAYFIHWPNSGIPIEETLGAMEKERQAGKIRHIGLSNITVNHMVRALEAGVSIQWVQVEMNPYFIDPALTAFCRERAIAVQAWAPLSRGRVSENSLLSQLSAKYGKTEAQISLRWIVQHGCIPLPSSKSEIHLKDNLDITDFHLNSEDMEKIDTNAKGGKRKTVSFEEHGFRDEFDFTYDQCWPK